MGGRLGENVSWRVRRSSIRTNNEMAMGCTMGQGLRMGTKMRWDEMEVFRHREWEWEWKWEWALFLLLLLGGCHCCSGSMSNDTMSEWESKWESHFGSFRSYCCGCSASSVLWFWLVLRFELDCTVCCAVLCFAAFWAELEPHKFRSSSCLCVALCMPTTTTAPQLNCQ